MDKPNFPVIESVGESTPRPLPKVILCDGCSRNLMRENGITVDESKTIRCASCKTVCTQFKPTEKLQSMSLEDMREYATQHPAPGGGRRMTYPNRHQRRAMEVRAKRQTKVDIKKAKASL